MSAMRKGLLIRLCDPKYLIKFQEQIFFSICVILTQYTINLPIIKSAGILSLCQKSTKKILLEGAFSKKHYG